MAEAFDILEAANVTKKGSKIELKKEKYKTIGLYFSAHWCPPCRGFTPLLAQYYTTCNDETFEIIFVSSDRDEASFKEYYGEMPWAALEFSDQDSKSKLASKYGISGIPTFIILDGATGETIDRNGRSIVMSKLQTQDFTAPGKK